MPTFLRIDTPLGEMAIGEDAGRIVRLLLPGELALCQIESATPLLTEASRQLRAYFAGDLRAFDLPLAPSGTPFQKAVWAALEGIPFGEIITYGELARRIGRPKASRAVGQANHKNPIPILIPCHRVIGADGSLTGYGGGLACKRFLLRLEGMQ